MASSKKQKTIVSPQNPFQNIHEKEIQEHKETIDEFRIWCQNIIQIPETIENFQLIEFLNAAEYDLKEAQNLIHNHYKVKYQYAETLFENRQPFTTRLQEVWSVMRMLTLPKVTEEGYLILYTSLSNTNPKAFDLIASFQLLTMAIETTLLCEGLFPGYFVIGDANGISYHHFPLACFPIVKKILHYVQQALPIKVRALHILNLSKFGEKMYKIIKPLLHKEIVQMIHIHQENSLVSLHNLIPSTLLPLELGGSLGTLDDYQSTYLSIKTSLRRIFKMKFESLTQWFVIEEQQRKDVQMLISNKKKSSTKK